MKNTQKIQEISLATFMGGLGYELDATVFRGCFRKRGDFYRSRITYSEAVAMHNYKRGPRWFFSNKDDRLLRIHQWVANILDIHPRLVTAAYESRLVTTVKLTYKNGKGVVCNDHWVSFNSEVL